MSRTGRASDCCSARVAPYKFEDAIQYMHRNKDTNIHAQIDECIHTFVPGIGHYVRRRDSRDVLQWLLWSLWAWWVSCVAGKLIAGLWLDYSTWRRDGHEWWMVHMMTGSRDWRWASEHLTTTLSRAQGRSQKTNRGLRYRGRNFTLNFRQVRGLLPCTVTGAYNMCKVSWS